MATPTWGEPTPSPYGPPPVAPKKSKAKGCAGVGCLGLFVAAVIIGIVSVAASKSSPSSDSATAPPPVGSTATKGAAPAKAATLLTLSGSGIENTAQFTTDGNWTLKYSYDCSSFGQAGNFVVSDETGMPLVNEMNLKGSGSTPQYDSGTHHLEVNSECDWTVTVIG
jgi:hypothetical protein